MKITPGGVVAAEWTKFSSLRSTWITTGISVFLLIAFGMIASASFSGDGMTSVDLALSGSVLAALSVGVLGALLGASDPGELRLRRCDAHELQRCFDADAPLAERFGDARQ